LTFRRRPRLRNVDLGDECREQRREQRRDTLGGRRQLEFADRDVALGPCSTLQLVPGTAQLAGRSPRFAFSCQAERGARTSSEPTLSATSRATSAAPPAIHVQSAADCDAVVTKLLLVSVVVTVRVDRTA
jgi:hypothetical protein